MPKYTIERALIMAAGFGQRLQPVTLTTPKPLIKVNNIRIIDTQIEALHKNGIYEIYVVVGYLKEQFYSWAKQYDGVTLIENPWYDTCNNISSLYAAREHLENAIIMDGDQLIYNPSILCPYFSYSGYSCMWTNLPTTEWLLTVNNGTVISCSRNGGTRGWQLFSVSRWTSEDGKRLKQHLEYEFGECQNRNIFWDDVVLSCHLKDYQLGVYPIHMGDIVEIDSFIELCHIDPTYINGE